MRPLLEPRWDVSRVAPRLLACCVLALVAGDAGVVVGKATLPLARAEEGWSAEFESVCSKTQDAMVLSSDELRALIVRCDTLKPKIDALDESRRKVYGKRLQQCRDLYDFVLKSREKG